MVMRNEIESGEVIVPANTEARAAPCENEHQMEEQAPGVARLEQKNVLVDQESTKGSLDTIKAERNEGIEDPGFTKPEDFKTAPSLSKSSNYEHELKAIYETLKVFFTQIEKLMCDYPNKKDNDVIKLYNVARKLIKLDDEEIDQQESYEQISIRDCRTRLDNNFLDWKERADCIFPLIESKFGEFRRSVPIGGRNYENSVLLPSLDKIDCEYLAKGEFEGLCSTLEATPEGPLLTVKGSATIGKVSEMPVFSIRIKSGSTYLQRIQELSSNSSLDISEFLKLTYLKYLLGYEPKWTLPVRPDPSKLWNRIAVPEGTKFPKKDTDYAECGAPGEYFVIAGSQRGRSHWHQGSPRDDDFAIRFDEDKGWNLLVVADGAGSKKYSREGSKVVCEYLKANAIQAITEQAEEAFAAYVRDPDSEEKERNARVAFYSAFIGDGSQSGVLHRALLSLREVAHKEGCKPNDFATTLLLTMTKKYDEGWFFVSFMVGDGAIALYDENDSCGVKLLGDPDEGEYSGQTVFFTMDSVWKDGASLFNRIHVKSHPDFTALFLMTDGVSDPKFETDAQLKNKTRWKNLYEEIKFQAIHDVHKELRAPFLAKYLEFYSEGNHDDRTLVMMTKG